MKLQNQRDKIKAYTTHRLPYHTPPIFIENKMEMLKIFLKQLTFQGMREPMHELANEEVEKLRQIIDKIYVYSQDKRLSALDVEGIWPLLTFSFESRCGLELYLHFENLLVPVDNRHQIIAQNVKVQHSEEFNPQGYFQNNEWKNNKKFMKSIRVLEKELPKRSQDAWFECTKMLDYLAIQAGQSSDRQNEFKTKFQAFFKKMDTQKKNKQTQCKLGGLSNVFATRMLQEQQQRMNEKYVLSEPDFLHNTFMAFTHDEYMHLHESKSLVKNQIQPIIQEDQQPQSESSLIFDEADHKNEHSARQSRTLKHKRAPIDKLSSPTKKRMPGYRKNQTPRKRQIKRPPRKLVVQRFFKLQKSKNIILDQIKRQKKKKQKQVKRKSRLDRVKRKIIESDEQQGRKKRNKRIKKMHVQDFSQSESQLQDDSRYFHSHQHQRRRIEHSLPHEESQEEIVMKRRRNQFKGHAYQHFIEDDASQDQSNFISEDTLQERTNKMDIQYSHKVINTKLDPYSIGKIRPNVQDARPLEKLKIENLQIRRLQLDNNYSLDMSIDFSKYQGYLHCLQPKQIKKQAEQIIKELINRQEINYDIDLTLKIIALWTMSKVTTEKRQQIWEQMNQLIISPLLQYIISVNCYRTNTELLNNFFVSAENQDLNEINKAKKYFEQVFYAGQSFKIYNLYDQLMKIFYNSMLTPKKMENPSMNTAFFSQCQIVCLSNPFKIGTRQAKFRLCENQDKIAYLVGSLVLQTLFLQGNASNVELFKTKKREFLINLKQQLNDLNKKHTPQWFYSLTNTIKKFYSCYTPIIDDEYFSTLVGFVNLSLEKLMIQSVTSENDVETKNQTNFLLELIDYYVEFKKSQGKLPYLLNLLNTLTVRSGVNKVLKDDKHSIISYMAYSSVSKRILNLLLPLPIDGDQKDKTVAHFMKYLSTLVPHFSRILSPLKINIYLPVFQLISQIYTYQIQARLQKNTDSYYPLCQQEHKEIRSIIQSLWEALEKKYQEFNNQLQNLCQQMKKSVEKANDIQNINNRKVFQDKIDKCEKAFKIFLKNFIFPDANNEDKYSILSSKSHYFFGLEFVLKQNYFLKYLKRRNNRSKQAEIQNPFLQILNFWLKPPLTHCQQKNFESKYYQSILQHYNSQYVHKKKIEMDIISDIEEPTILQIIAMIQGTQITAAVQHTKLINSPESNIMKLVRNSVNAYSAKFANIHKSVCCLQSLLERLQDCLHEKQVINNLQQRNRQIKRIKSYFWNDLIFKSARDIVFLIFLAFTTQHATDFQAIPINNMLRRLKDIIDINPRQINYKDIGYHYLLYSLQTSQNFNSIRDLFDAVQQQNKLFGWKDFDKQLTTVLKDLFQSLKRLQQVERNKQPVITQSLKILCFIVQRPQPDSELIKNYLKQTQMTSNAQSLITKLRINEQNVQILLNFFDSVHKMNDNPHKIKETMTIYIDWLASKNDKSLEHLKQVRRFLGTLRLCLVNNNNLQVIGNMFLRQFLQKFCTPSILQSFTNQLAIQRLQIYLQMMRNSVHQRSAYEYLIVQNRKKYQEVIPKLMLNANGDHRQPCKTFQNIVLTYMIDRYSNLLDIKRLLGSMKKEVMESMQSQPAKRQVYINLISKLRSVAMQTRTEYITQWCNQQIKQIKMIDIFEEQLMDIQ